jgi:hypothetical protein
MAVVLKKLPEMRRGGRPQVYDWDTLFDGKPRQLTKGVDFYAIPRSFRISIYRAAARKRARVTVLLDGDTLYVQAKK